MGCGCGKSTTPGVTSSNPLVLGTADGSEVQRVRILQNTGGAPAGTKRYVTGSDVPALIASGAIRVL